MLIWFFYCFSRDVVTVLIINISGPNLEVRCGKISSIYHENIVKISRVVYVLVCVLLCLYVYLQVVFPDIEAAYYENTMVQRIMLYTLKHYQFYADGDKNFRKTLRYLAFMPKGDML